MTLKPPIGREDYRPDLTRWNRAGLSRFNYVDGNAAMWLEELRLGMLAGYLRSIDPDDRISEKWRDLFTKPASEWQLPAAYDHYAQSAAWAELLPVPPAETENGIARNRRLTGQYDRQSPDYAWEIMRAFARAAHILLGHQDAYANEGYLRTATQWDNLRKLAAMVNYQPTPPASATTTVALKMTEGTGTIEVARGLAMKYAPPEGGVPLIFETLKPLKAHPDLNATRAHKWNVNSTVLGPPAGVTWIVPEKTKIAQGDAVVLAGWQMVGFGRTLMMVDHDEETGLADLEFEPTGGVNAPMAETTIHCEPEGVRRGLPVSGGSQLVIAFEGAASITQNSIVAVSETNGSGFARAVVASASGKLLVLNSSASISGDVSVEVYTPIDSNSDGVFETPLDVSRLYFRRTDGTVARRASFTTRDSNDDGDIDLPGGKRVAREFQRPANTVGSAFASRDTNRVFTGTVAATPSWATPALGAAVHFEGKPPKGLKQGDWYVAREVSETALTALKVTGVRIEADTHYVVFCPAPPAAAENTEFFGPMTKVLRPLHHDRNPDDAVADGACILEGLSDAARDLLKPGKDMLIVHERDGVKKAGQATVTGTEVQTNGALKVTLETETDFTGWEKGWTSFHLNTVAISHGETKDPKTLGSGDAELQRQDFRFKVDNVSFIPSTAAVSGVAPDMDVAVDGVKWEYRDLGDPTAEGTNAWSVKLNDDDTLQIHFRRRLPSGTNNASVPRHRAGVGLSGTGVPSWSFTAPMKKNRFATAIVQPYATAGGADREPVTAMRESAPANLAANGRAVSLKDFERLCRRHASVWQAKARQVIGPAAANLVDVIVVPAGGGAVSEKLADDLTEFVLSRALPGLAMTISAYQDLLVEIAVTVHVDTARYEKSDVQDAVALELAGTFSLERRGLGQPLYVAEILAAAERVEGVETVVIDAFTRKAGAPQPLREALMGGALSALFAREEQLIHAASSDIVVHVEAAS